ncbi:MAG TPA: glycosyltransferase [Verrucomicrobiae bacterium]|nr:glycosyltransferase [Verrucomicrobiae bacterium]
MKLLVFAHTPPPHHGQSFMVKMLLDHLREDSRFECHHVDARFSDEVGQIGQASLGKIKRALKFSLAAIRLRFRHRVTTFYYVPASATRAAMYRDWVVMALCRPFFSKFIFHWHSAGLADWLINSARPWERAITRFLLRRPALCIVLAENLRHDAEFLNARRVEVIPNGLPDPCPQFWSTLAPARQARLAELRALMAGQPGSASPSTRPPVFRVLFLSLCMREKGLFDAVEAIALANRQLTASGHALRMQLIVAGKFYLETGRVEFEQRVAQPDLNGSAPADAPVASYRGFVSGETKGALFREADCFCFPSYYPMEGHPVSVVEALAHGLPVVASRWRALPDLFPENYPGLVNPKAPEELAAKLLEFVTLGAGAELRRRYEALYWEASYIERMKAALLQVEHERA